MNIKDYGLRTQVVATHGANAAIIEILGLICPEDLDLYFKFIKINKQRIIRYSRIFETNSVNLTCGYYTVACYYHDKYIYESQIGLYKLSFLTDKDKNRILNILEQKFGEATCEP